MTTLDDVMAFHHKYQVPIGIHPAPVSLLDLRADLVFEEAEEVADALSDTPLSLEAVAKELADLVYVAYGTAASLGLDLDEALARVHASNMTKDGGLRADGKILKGDGYVAPDMTGVVL